MELKDEWRNISTVMKDLSQGLFDGNSAINVGMNIVCISNLAER